MNVSPSDGILITREQLEDWARRPLTDDDVASLDDAIPMSSIPEAIGDICDSIAREYRD